LNQDLLKKLLLCRCFHKTCVFFVTAQVNAKFVLQSINVFFYQIDTGCPKNALHVSVCYFKNEIQGKELLYLKMVQELGGRKKRKRSIGMANKYHQHLDTM